jgi:subtilisin family serine protease
VASAGNEGSVCATVQSPIALYDEVFSVGAVDRAGGLASFSSRGPVTADGSNRTKPDIVAPGVEVLSSFPGGTYSISSGTSMAGPHVAGVVALLWSAAPDLIGDIDATEQLIAGTADPYDIAQFGVPGCGEPGLVPDNATGYGLVNAFAAVSAARAAR